MREGMPVDKTDLRSWYRGVCDARVLTPKTVVVEAGCRLGDLSEVALPVGYCDFLSRLRAAADSLGYPCFVRTSHGAAKLRWRRSCWVESPGVLHDRAVELSRWSRERGLPVECLVVRQAVPVATYFAIHEGTPVGREWRAFVRGGDVLCLHPLWPKRGVALGRPDVDDWVPLYEDVAALAAVEEKVLATLSSHLGRSLAASGLSGDWAIDWAMLADGRWVAIDLDDPETCWHWPHCPHHPAAIAASPDAAPAPIDPASYAIDPTDPDALPEFYRLEACFEE